MATDELWNIRSNNDLWICVFCLSAIAKRPGSTSVDSVVRHLENCRHFALGKGQPQNRPAIVERRSYENIVFSAQSDPAWKIYDHDGVWLSPFSLMRVAAVRTTSGKLDNFLFQALAKHLGQCPFYRQGIAHTVEEVQLARELHRRMPEVVRFARYQLHTQSSWRWVNEAGLWICPYTLFAVAQVRLSQLSTWTTAAEAIALHLITQIPLFATGRAQPHAETSIAHAAGTQGCNLPPAEAHTPTPMSPEQILGTATPSGLAITPTPTATRSVSGGNTILASRIQANTATPASTSTLSNSEGASRPGTLFTRTPISQAISQTVSQAIEPLPIARRVTPVATSAMRATPPSAVIPTPLAMPVVPARNSGGSPPLAFPVGSSGPRVAGLSTVHPSATDPAPAAATETADTHLDWMDQADSDHDIPREEIAPRTDMIHARKLQEKFLQQAPAVPGFQIASRFEACTDITGDFFVFIPLPQGCIGFAIGDVSGHGVQAGLIMSMAKKTLEIYAAQGMGPADTLARVNDALVPDLGGKMFISMCYAVMDPNEGTITWARAGHNPAMHYNLVSEKAGEIRPKGMVVGMKSGAIFRQSLEEEVTHIEPGDVFLLYTDGITETMNLQHEEFGAERLTDIVKQFSGDGPDVMVDQIMDRIRHFRGPRPPADDATMVAMLVE